MNHHSKISVAWGIGTNDKVPQINSIHYSKEMTQASNVVIKHRQLSFHTGYQKSAASGTNCIAWQTVKQSIEC